MGSGAQILLVRGGGRMDFFQWVGKGWNDITGATAQANSVNQAADTQSNAVKQAQQTLNDATARAQEALASGNQQAIAEQRAAVAAARAQLEQSTAQALSAQSGRFDQARGALDPYAQSGSRALEAQNNLLGIGAGGAEAQQQAYAALQNSPAFKALSQAGNDQILAGASATGGVRGGNTQGALAQFGTQNLANLIGQQYNQLGGLSQMGYGAAGAQSNLYGQQGQNEANLYSGQGQSIANLLQNSGANISQLLSGGGQSLANLLFQSGQGISGLQSDLGAIQSGRELGLGKAYGDSTKSFWGGLGTLGGALLGGPIGASLGSSLFGGGGNIVNNNPSNNGRQTQ